MTALGFSSPYFPCKRDEVEGHDLFDARRGIAARLEQSDEAAELVGAAQSLDERQRVGILAGGADAGGAALGDLRAHRGAEGGHVVDAGSAAVGADADMVLAADV